MAAAILNFLKGDWEEDDDDKSTSKNTMSGHEIVNLLTSLCSTNNGSIKYCGEIMYGIEGAVIKKEKSRKRHNNGEIGRVYLIDHDEQNHDGYRVGWVLNDAYPDCMVCSEAFEFLSRSRHHCRGCGILVCDDCSKERVCIAQLSRNKFSTWRVCDLCVTKHPPNVMWNLYDAA